MPKLLQLLYVQLATLAILMLEAYANFLIFLIVPLMLLLEILPHNNARLVIMDTLFPLMDIPALKDQLEIARLTQLVP